MDFKNLNPIEDFINNLNLSDDESLNYEETIFKDMSKDIKSSYTKQLNEISKSVSEQLELAKKESKEAKKDAFIARVIAIISLIVAIVAIILPIVL